MKKSELCPAKSLLAKRDDKLVPAVGRPAWRMNKHWQVAVVGDNLLHERHGEFLPAEVQTQATEIPRSVFAEVTFQI